MSDMRLSDIVGIQWWVYKRSWKWKDVVLLNANDFDDYWGLKDTLMPTLTFEDCPQKHILQDSDILLVTKGSRFLSALYRSSFWPCIASTSFLVLRIKQNIDILPQYLSILMNEALQSRYFKNRTRGSVLFSLQRKDVSEYRISIPSLQKQQTIIHIYHQHKQQKNIYVELINKKHHLIHSLILSSS